MSRKGAAGLHPRKASRLVFAADLVGRRALLLRTAVASPRDMEQGAAWRRFEAGSPTGVSGRSAKFGVKARVLRGGRRRTRG